MILKSLYKQIKQRSPFSIILNRSPAIRSSRGIALLQTLFLVLLIEAIVMQISFEVNVDYAVNSQSLQRIRAYRAAKAAMDLSLLRIKIYNQIMQSDLAKMGDAASMAKMIYQMPFSWPFVLPDESSSVDKDALKKVNKAAFMTAIYSSTIRSEDLLNINDLNSPIEGQRNRVRTKIIDLIQNKIDSDQDWADRNNQFQPDEIADHLKDWIDPDTDSTKGGDESSIYSDLRELDSDIKDRFPPNRFFRTIDEIRMVPGVTDDVFEVLSPTFSVFGPMGINPNYADSGALKSLHKSMTDEVIQKIKSRRDSPKEGGPFKEADDFFNYVSSVGGQIPPSDQEKIPLRFTEPCNFRIEATGGSGRSAVTLTAVTFDLTCSQAELSKGIDQEKKDKGSSTDSTSGSTGSGDSASESGNSTNGGSSPKQALPKGPPRIVYWNER